MKKHNPHEILVEYDCQEPNCNLKVVYIQKRLRGTTGELKEILKKSVYLECPNNHMHKYWVEA